MKIAELFASIGFKVEGKDELLQFEKTMQNIATAARNAALALKILARTQVPRAFVVRPPSATPPGAPATTPAAPTTPGLANPTVISNPAFIGPVQPAPYAGPTPPKLPGQSQTLPPSVLQGLKSLGMLALKIGGIATVAAALKKLVSALTDMVRVSTQAALGMDKLRVQTGLTQREVKKWEHVGALAGIKSEEVADVFKQFRQRFQAIRWTGEGATLFTQLGIDPGKSPDEVMRQFFKRTASMSADMQTYFGNQLGISEDWIYAMRKFGDQIDKLLPGLEQTDEQLTNVIELSAAWKELTFNLGALKDKIVSDFAPGIKWVADQVTTWVKIMTVSKPIRDWVLRGGPMTQSFLLPSVRDARPNNSTKVENNVEVNVEGADRPKETARAAAEAVDRAMSDAYYQQFPANAGI